MNGLRDYQQELLERAEAALQSPDARVMLQLPTGGGKTHIAGALLRRWLHDGRKAVWLTHRTELADQTHRMLTEAGVSAIRPAWDSGSDVPFIANGVVILMAQTVGRRNKKQIWGNFDSDDLLVIDEAHHAPADGYRRAIQDWPGPTIGLTATPWRLSKAEGFNHLFKELYCGPQVSELQADKWLCQARVLMPKPEDIIRGGTIAGTGDYNESGIELANQDRHDILTAGALRFWQAHAAERQTVVYAISQDHARNLTAVFNDAGIPAAVMLSDTPPDERGEAIKSFGNGTLRVLVNVAVATEGFDLPDASCVVITRPTMSLALYLQMVGRGLRPKANGGDCLILDLAGNAELQRHGLPEDERQWSLAPRGNNAAGDAPVIRCEKCDGVSPAASQNCVHCGADFGKVCPRCGVWRAWERWSYETRCGYQHDLVCDLCHYDAHIQANLPVTDELRRLAEMETDLDAALRHLLEEERRKAAGSDDERKDALRSIIAARESELQEYRLFPEMEDNLKREIAGWKGELDKLESKVPDGRLVYNNARDRVLQTLESAAQDAGLIAQTRPNRRTRESGGQSAAEINGPPATNATEWMSFVQLGEWGNTDPSKPAGVKPNCFREPNGNEVPIRSWPDLIFQTAEWLIRERLINRDGCPIKIGTRGDRYLINSRPVNARGTEFHGPRQLSNGLHIECNASGKDAARLCGQLLAEFGQDPAQFHVRLG